MEVLIVLVSIMTLLGLIPLIFRGSVTAPGHHLAQQFRSLGVMNGKTEDEIVAVVGPPQSRGAQAGGNYLLQWQATGYHIAILFDPDRRFLGITHEYLARNS